MTDMTPSLKETPSPEEQKEREDALGFLIADAEGSINSAIIATSRHGYADVRRDLLEARAALQRGRNNLII